MRPSFRFGTLVLILLVGRPVAPRAQTPDCFCDTMHWKLCTSQFGLQGGTPYFINGKIGFVFLAGNTSWTEEYVHAPLYRTLDSGKNWQLCDTSYRGAINELYFVSVNHGYAAVVPTQNAARDGGGVYETWDTGYSWRLISNDSATGFSNVRAIGDYVISLGSNYNGYLATATTDDGLTWKDQWAKYRPLSQYNDNGLISNEAEFIATIGWYNSQQSIVATTDQGQTWNPFPTFPPIILDYGSHPFCIPRRHTIFVESNEKVFRNVDLSPSWDTLIPGTQGTFQSEIEGAGCAIYINTATGGTGNPWDPGASGLFYRSTDVGQTWQVFSSPAFLAYSPQINHFSVVGNGSTIYTITGLGYIYRTTDGGDGALAHVSDVHTISLGSILPTSAIGDTLETTLCDSTSFAFHFQFTGSCNYAWLDSVSIDGIDPIEYRISQTHNLPSLNLPDTAWISIAPSKAGLRTLTVHAIYTNDDKEERDTTFSIKLNVSHNPGMLDLVTTSPIDFGAQSIWTGRRLTDTFAVGGHGCEAVIISSISFKPYQGSSGFTFKNVGSFTANTLRTFSISYKPINAETDSGLVLISYFDGALHRTDTVRVIGMGLDDRVALVSTGTRPEPFSIELRPNPASTEMTVTVSGSGVPDAEATLPDGETSLQFCDMLGRQCKSVAALAFGINSVSVVDLLPGVYYVRVGTGGLSQTRRLTILR